MTVLSAITDGLTNIVAGIAEGMGKRGNNTYVAVTQNTPELINSYRSSAVAKKIVDLPAEDAVREWREWQAQAEQITLIEAEEARLGVMERVLKARVRARLMGGCAIYIGIRGDNTPDALMEPLDPRRAANGGLEYLTVISRDDIGVGQLDRDPRSPNYGMPSKYTILSNANGQALIDVHPSRMVRFIGEPLPDERYGAENLGWGDSSLLSCIQSVSDLDATMANLAELVFEAKVDVMGIDGFNDGLKSGGAAYENVVKRRGQLIKAAKGINGMLMKDKEDTYDQKSASFAGLPDMVDRFMQMTSAASSIPMTNLFGMSPGGLNATGESDTRVYYDRIKVEQTQTMQPAMSVLDECLIWSALGSRPEEIHYNWRPLWQPTAKERAENGKATAETFKALYEMTELPPEALDEAIVNALTETGAAPGLEGLVAKYLAGEGESRSRDADQEGEEE